MFAQFVNFRSNDFCLLELSILCNVTSLIGNTFCY